MLSIISNLSIGLILGSTTMHMTHKYEPTEGYNQANRSLGIDVVEKGEGWHPGFMAFRFDDSYDKTSAAILGTYGYADNFDVKGLTFDYRAGVGAGYTRTSYYEGAVGSVFVEGCQGHHCVQLSGIPKLTNVDAVLMAQYKFRF